MAKKKLKSICDLQEEGFFDKSGMVKIDIIRGHQPVGSEDNTTTGEGILVIAFTVAILAGCGILGVIFWASQQPIY